MKYLDDIAYLLTLITILIFAVLSTGCTTEDEDTGVVVNHCALNEGVEYSLVHRNTAGQETTISLSIDSGRGDIISSITKKEAGWGDYMTGYFNAEIEGSYPNYTMTIFESYDAEELNQGLGGLFWDIYDIYDVTVSCNGVRFEGRGNTELDLFFEKKIASSSSIY